MDERFWDGFAHDPRLREHAGLRASDADRERAHAAVSEAYADGRLDRDELEVRLERLAGRLTLGELALLLTDLEPATAPSRPARTRRPSTAELAVAVASTLVCLLVWQVSGRGFFWPVWVIVYTGLPVAATLVAGRTTTAG
jgi:hypothetical protein